MSLTKNNSNTDNQIYMKKRVLFYITAIVTFFSLQSCVTNYVVSEPISYKANAKLSTIPSKSLNNIKTALNSENSIDATLANIEKTNKEIEKTGLNLYNEKITELLAEADTYLGTPYRYGGTTRSGIDCSAFVLSVFGATMGIQLPRVAASQAQEGERISKDELKKGDLVFFAHSKRIAHVGIVHEVNKETGEVKFIHSATSRGVMVSSLDDKYWGPRYRFAQRVINENHISDYQSLAKNLN